MSVAITYLKQQIMENDDDLLHTIELVNEDNQQIMEKDDDILHAIELVNEDKQQFMEKDATIVSQGGGGQARE